MKSWTPEDIKKLRLKLKMSQKAFAELLGTTNIYINYLEKGVRNPSLILKRLFDCIEKEKKKRR